MGGKSSTQGRCIDLSWKKGESAAALAHADTVKSGHGVATSIAIDNQTDYRLEHMMYEGFAGRFDWDYPEQVEPEKCKVFVHCRRDGAWVGSAGYLCYGVHLIQPGTLSPPQLFKIAFAWSSPALASCSVGCGWFETDAHIAREDQEKMASSQLVEDAKDCKPYGVQIKIKIIAVGATSQVVVTISNKSYM